MKKLQHSIIILLLLSILLSGMAAPVAASAENQFKAGVFEYSEEASSSGYLYWDLNLPNENQPEDVESYGASYPTQYDARAGNIITPVKNQKQFGTCWAFTALSAAETELVKNNSWAQNADFSELHMAYFAYHPANDPLNLITNDTTTALSGDYLNTGGNGYIATAMLASWAGPVQESRAPYSKVTDASQPLSVSLRNSLAYNANAARLEDAYWVQCSFNSAGVPNYKKYIEDIKYLVTTYGSAGIAYQSSQSFYNSATYAHYTPPTGVAGETYVCDHAVTVVGWNDAFPATNFNETPQGDGAWLIKNSWGETYGDDGYFWLSYYDQSIIGDMAYAFNMGESAQYDYNYQYDGTPSVGHFYTGGKKVVYANVYTSQQTEILKAVSFSVLNSSANYTIRVYKDVKTTPSSGTLVSTQTGSTKYWGQRTVPLSNPVSLSAGQKFSVSVELSTGSEVALVPADISNASAAIRFNATMSSGQSYVSENSRDWVDTSVSNLNGNVRVKALTVADHSRLAGSSRFGTAVQISRASFKQGAANVVLVNGLDYPDALAASPLAYALAAPILMSGGGSGGTVDENTMQEIARLDADTIYIIGGKNAVSSSVESTLRAKGYTVKRIAGANRYETAAKIAEELRRLKPFDTVVIASGENYPDALSVGAAAAKNGYPILFVSKYAVPSETLSVLNSNVQRAYIVGGTSAVSWTAQTKIPSAVSVTRLAGEDRIETAVKIQQHFFADVDTIYAATAFNYADALAGGVAAARDGAAMLLIDGQAAALPTVITRYIQKSTPNEIVVLGGTAAVSEKIKILLTP